jgi:hypothetical protein
METNDGISPVIGPAQELSELGLGHALGHFGDFCRGLVKRLFTLFVFCDIEEKTRLFEIRSVLLPGIYDAFKRSLLFKNSLSLFRVIPEIGLRGNFVEFFCALLFAVDVKDASAEARVALLGG